jgi:hypothetical protein
MRDATLAWQTANLTQRAAAGKLPPLRDVLRKAKGSIEGQERHEQRAEIYKIAAALGKRVTKTRLIRTHG